MVHWAKNHNKNIAKRLQLVVPLVAAVKVDGFSILKGIFKSFCRILASTFYMHIFVERS